MALSTKRSRRKSTGGRYHKISKKKSYALSSSPTHTGLGNKNFQTTRTRSGKKKTRILKTNIANVYSQKEKKFEQLKIITILENPANRHFVRRNIMTKGTIIKTERGNAKITSRPGQHGIVNAVLIEKP